MNTSKLKRLIIILIIITIIIFAVTMIIMSTKKAKEKTQLQEQQDLYADMLRNPSSILNGQKPQIVQEENIYFNVKSSIERYFKYLEEGNSKAVYDTLNMEYIQNNQINESNVLSKVNRYTNVSRYEIKDMYEISGVKYMVFYIRGNIQNQEILINADLDFENETFCIRQMSEEEFVKALDTTIEGQTGSEKQINKNQYNQIPISNLQEGEVVKQYLLDYINCMKNNPDKAYGLLDTEYKEKRFSNVEEYKKYINDNKDKINTITMTSYGVKVVDNQKQYTCKDNYDNYYTFKKISAMKYTVIPDNYTLESEEYKEEYNKLSEEQKVKTNVEKFVKMLNSKNYNQAYKVLNQEFKQNYFKTQINFEKYIKNSFFDDNMLGIKSIKKQGSVYMCETNIKESLSSAARSIDKTFVILLKDNGAFEISFNIK